MLEAIRSRAVPESGVAFIDEQGRAFATFGRNDSGHGSQAMTSEYEIMRGDLVDVLYRASLGMSLDKDADEAPERRSGDEKSETTAAIRKPDTTSSGNVRYIFDATITSLAQDATSSESVKATFSDGREARYDLVVAADGQSSRTRRMILGPDASNAAFRSLGLFSALYLVPRAPEDDSWMNWHLLPGRRSVITRAAASSARTQVYMNLHTTSASASASQADGVRAAVASGSVAAQKEAFSRAFADRRGRVGRLVEAMAREDVYVTEIAQVRCERLVAGRVVLLGDAGYCPSPISGMGTTLALTGAYVLAGELARRRGARGDLEGALRAYEEGVRPFVQRAQTLPPGTPGILYAESSWGVWLITTVIWLVAKTRVLDVLLRIWPDDPRAMKVPEYPELNLKGDT